MNKLHEFKLFVFHLLFTVFDFFLHITKTWHLIISYHFLMQQVSGIKTTPFQLQSILLCCKAHETKIKDPASLPLPQLGDKTDPVIY